MTKQWNGSNPVDDRVHSVYGNWEIREGVLFLFLNSWQDRVWSCHQLGEDVFDRVIS